MKIYCEKSLKDFEYWSGAVETAERITKYDKWDELEVILEEMYPDGIDETELNDYLWFDDDNICEMLEIPTYDQEYTKEKIDEYPDELIEQVCEDEGLDIDDFNDWEDILEALQNVEEDEEEEEEED